MLQRQFGRCRQQILENHVETCRHPAHQRIDQAPQERRLATPEKLVEDQHLAAGADDASDFRKTKGGFRDHGEDQVQHGAIEAGSGEGQVLGVALHRLEVDMRGAGQGTAQHGLVEVEADVMVLSWQVWQIKAGADTGQQDAPGFGRQGGQAALAGRLCRPGDPRVVERGDQRVAVLQAQCRTRGMASVNSGISASKCVPSSATIW